MGKYSCAIGGCPEKSYAKSAGVKFFYLATLTDENVKNAWKDKILSTRADISNRNQINDVAICSRHFVDGDKRNLPTIIPKVNSKKEVIWPEQKTRRTIISCEISLRYITHICSISLRCDPSWLFNGETKCR